MAAAKWSYCVLRTTWRGVFSFPQTGSNSRYPLLARPLQTDCSFSAPGSFTLQQCRHGSFFNKLTANELWKGVLAETGAGGRKGRGKRTKKKLKKDLNRGQSLGDGRSGFLWPGLNAAVLKSGTIQTIGKRDEAQLAEMQAELIRKRDEWEKQRRTKMKRERGWTGNSWGGVSIGCPDPGPNGETYEDFDSRIIELKNVFTMTGNEGRKKSVSALVVVGNGKGAAGFALGKASERPTALRKAKNRAIHYLHFIERYQDHTIYHNIATKYNQTSIRMTKKNRGYGLRCHRAIITICKLIGITDMFAKVSGAMNMLSLTRALFMGLTSQETHQTLAEKKALHVVEFRDECGPLPFVVASPKGEVRKEGEPEDEVPDTKLDWNEVKAAQGMSKSPWSKVKRTVW